MTKVREIYDALCRIAPPALQLSFDNAGFLVGHADAEVKTVLLSLDITGEVIDEGGEIGAQLIVSHHPVIFHPLRSVTSEGEGALVLRLIESRIAAICMHTNLDIAEGGVNDMLLEKLGAVCEGALDEDGCGRVGQLKEPMPLPDFLSFCKDRLHVNALRYVDAGKAVKRLAVMGGAGGEAMHCALARGCDTYVTADVKYHQFLNAAELGLNLIDADHFCTENPVMPILAEKLRGAFPEVEFRLSTRHRQIISVY